MRIIVLFIALFIATSSLYSQKNFSGVIKYAISYESENVNPDNEKNNILPKEMIVTYREVKSKTEIQNSLGRSIIIGDSETQTTIILIEAGDSKLAVRNSKDEREKALSDMPDVLLRYTDETKTILGFNCKKVEVIQGDKKLEAYFTEDIKIDKVNWQNEFKDIKGVLLEYTQISDDVSTRYIATSVNKQKVKKKEFDIPKDYKIVTKKELADALSSIQ